MCSEFSSHCLVVMLCSVIVQVLCSYSTLPLYTLVTQVGIIYLIDVHRSKRISFDKNSNMFLFFGLISTELEQMGSRCKLDKVDDKAEMESSPLFHRMTKESNQHSQINEQAIIMMEDHAISSTIELHPIIQSSLEKT